MTTAIRSTMFGAGIGAGLMFMLDPACGARRRALVRDKINHVAHKTRDAYGATQRELGNRLAAVAAATQTGIRTDTADDRTVERRVRTELGRVCSHPRAVRVNVVNGSVTLSGDVWASEASSIKMAIGKVPGVQHVMNQVTLHAANEEVSALQGDSPRADWSSSWIAGNWSPTAKLMAALCAVGCLAFAVALRRQKDGKPAAI